MKILHIDSSTTGADSVTRELTAHAMRQLNEAYPDAEVIRLDLDADTIPHLEDGRPEPNRYVEQVKDIDLFVIGAPTYNFTVPTQLKSWFDRIAMAGETFRYTEDGPQGLLSDKRAIVAIASGGNYDDGHAFEHNKSYVKAFLNFLGIEPEIVEARGLAISEDAKAEAIAEAKQAIDQLVGKKELEPA
ncbi:NAD(P)H-dependent oxidoreductase [Sphingomicrobium sp. XHP0239]|uniref:FMN-dependent NADH-azoreductase n=1 Tax=Sphingomicrobium maritimum TaxID=3133972 RepID=UPI0031CCAD96